MGIKEFFEKLNTDSAFAENYSGLKDAAAFIEQAKKDGYTITAEEVTKMLKAAADGKVSDEELDNVTGGGFLSRTCPTCGKTMGSICFECFRSMFFDKRN